MAKQAVLDVLNSVLGKYISDLDVESLSLSLWSGSIEFTKGLSIDTAAVNQHKLMQASPVQIQSGAVGCIRINVPWASLASKSVTIQISNIELTSTWKGDDGSSLSKIKNDVSLPTTTDFVSQQTHRRSRLDEIDELDQLRLQQETLMRSWMLENEQRQDSVTALKSPASKSKETFTGRLMRRIIENIQLDISDVHLCVSSATGSRHGEVESSNASRRSPQFSCGVKLQRLSVFSTDASGNRSFVDRSPHDQFLFKSMMIEGFGVYLVETSSIDARNNESGDTDNKGLDFLIHPLSFTASLRQFDAHVDQSQGDASYFSSLPEKYLLNASLPTLSVGFSHKQLCLANFLLSSVLSSSGTGVADEKQINPIFPQYRPSTLRPTDSKEAAKEWWHYAFKCVHCLQYGYPQLKSSMWGDFMDKFRLRVQYIALYKRYKYSGVDGAIVAKNLTDTPGTVLRYEPLSENEFTELINIESKTDISVEGIVAWRAMADAQIRYEQQRKIKKPIYPSDVVSAMAFAKSSRNESEKAQNILSIEELQQLDSALTQQEELIASKNLAYSQRPLLEFSFILGAMNVSLRTSKIRRILSFSLEGIEASYFVIFGGDLSLTLAIASLVALDEVTANSLFPEVVRVIDKRGNRTRAADSFIRKFEQKSKVSSNNKMLYFQYRKWANEDNEDKGRVGNVGESAANQHVRLRMAGLQCVASPLLVDEIKSLFILSDAIDIPPTPCIPSWIPYGSTDDNDAHALSQRNDSIKYADAPAMAKMYATTMVESVSSKLIIAWNETHNDSKKISVDCAIDAPILVVPKSCVDPSSPAFVLDLGYFRITSMNETAASIKTVFMEGCDEAFGKEKANAPFPSVNYRVEIQNLVVLLGRSGAQDWRSLGSSDVLNTGSLIGGLASETLIEPLTFSLDLRLDSKKFSKDTAFIAGVLQKVNMQLSLDHITDMVDIARSWTTRGSERKILQKHEADVSEFEDNNFKRSPTITNLSVAGMNAVQSTTISTDPAQIRFQFNAVGLRIRILANDRSYLETRLSSFLASASIYRSEFPSIKLQIGCFCIGYFSSESLRTDILFHTNIDQDMPHNNIAYQRNLVYKKMDEIEDLKNVKRSEVLGADISLCSFVSSNQILKSFDSQMSGVVVHWHVSTIEKVLGIQYEVMKRLSARNDKVDCSLTSANCEREDETQDAVVTTQANLSQPMQVRLTVASAGLFLYSSEDDSLNFHLTMSKTDFCLDIEGESTLNSRIDIGDLAVGSYNGERQCSWDKVLSLSSASQTALFCAIYRRGHGLKVDGETEHSYNSVALLNLSPMKCVCLHRQILSLLKYFSSGILGTITSQAASSAASAAKDVSDAVSGAQYYSLKAAGLEFIFPESYQSANYIASSMHSLNAWHQVLEDNISKSMMEMQGLTMRCNARHPIIPDDIEVKCQLNTSRGASAYKTRVVFEVSRSCLFLSKTDFIQILKTIEGNLDQNARSSSRTRGLKPTLIDDDRTELQATSAARSSISMNVQFQGFDLFLCESTPDIPILRMTVGCSQMTVVMLPDDTDKAIVCDFTLHNFEIKDVRTCINQSSIDFLISHSDEFGEEALFQFQFVRLADETLKMSCMLNGLQVCYLPELISVAMSVVRLPEIDESLAIDEDLFASPISVDHTNNMDGMTHQDEMPLSSVCTTLSFKTRNFKIIFAKATFNDTDSSSFVFKGDIDVQANAVVLKLNREISSYNLNLSGEKFEVYAAKLNQEALISPIQVMEPMSFELSSKYKNETLDMNAVFSSDVVVTISTLDYLLFSEIAFEHLPGKQQLQGALDATDTIFNGTATARMESLGSATDESEKKTSSRNVLQPNNNDLVVLSPRDRILDKSKVSVTVSLPFASFMIIHDMHYVDKPLFRVFLREFAFGGQLEQDKTSKLEALDPFFDGSINVAMSCDYFDSASRQWEPLLDMPWQLSMVGRRTKAGAAGATKGENIAVFEADAGLLRLLLKESVLATLGQAAAIFNCLTGSKGTLLLKNEIDTKSISPAGPYYIDNFSGFKIYFSVADKPLKECENGARQSFRFDLPQGSGVGRKRVYGVDSAVVRTIKFMVGASNTESNLSIENIDDKKEDCLKKHVLSNGIILFTEILAKDGAIGIKLQSAVTFYNYTRQDFCIALSSGQSCTVIGGVKSNCKRIGISPRESTEFPGIGVASTLINNFVTSDASLEFLINGTGRDLNISDWRKAGRIMLPSLSAFSEEKNASTSAESFEFLCSTGQLVETIGAVVSVAVNHVKEHELVKIYIRPRILVRNDLPFSILIMYPSFHFSGTEIAGENDLDSMSSHCIALLAPLDELPILAPYSSIEVSIQIENPTDAKYRMESFSDEKDSVTIPLYPRSVECLSCHVGHHDKVTNGNEIFISEIPTRNGEKVVSVNVPNLFIAFTGNVLVENLSWKPNDLIQSPATGYSGSGVFLSNFSCLKPHCFTTLISDSNASYRLVERNPRASGKHARSSTPAQKYSHPFHLEDIGVQSAELFWEDGSCSGYFMFRKLSTSSVLLKSEIHLIPQYVIFNGTDLSLSITTVQSSEVLVIEPNKVVPIRKDKANELVICVTIPEMNAIAGPVRVDGVGMRICPINEVLQNDNDTRVLAGTLAIQTAREGSEAHLVIKIGNMKLDGAKAAVAKEKVAIFPNSDAFVVRMNFSEAETMFQKNDGESDTNHEYESGVIASFGFRNFAFQFERGLKDPRCAIERTEINLRVGEFYVKDFSQYTENPTVICSTSGHNFLVLHACIQGPLNAGVLIDVRSVNITICCSPKDVNGKLVIDTNECFIWKLLDICHYVNRGAIEFNESLHNADVEVENTAPRYTPPKSDFIFIFKRVRIAPLLLIVSFERRPNASRYKEVRDVKWAALANYAMKELKFSLKNAKLYFSEYELEYIKGSLDQLFQIVSSVYLARLKYKWMVIVSSVSIDDWAVLAGRDAGEDQFVAGDLGRTLGLFVGATLGLTIKSAGLAIGGTVQAASEMMGIGSIGAGAKTIISGISTGTSKAIFGAGKGVGQILGGIEAGINTAKPKINDDTAEAVASLGQGVRVAGTNTATGVQTIAIGTAQGLRSATGGLLSGLKEILNGVLCPIITGAQSFSVCMFLHPVGRWVCFASFLLVLVSNVTIWTTFVSTNVATSIYFFNGPNTEGNVDIEVTSILFLIIYGPCSFLSSYGVETHGLRKNVLVGSLLTCIGAGMQCLGAALSTRPIKLVLAGQILVGFGHPFLVNSTGLICSNWFGRIGCSLGLAMSVVSFISGIFASELTSVILLFVNKIGSSQGNGRDAPPVAEVSMMLHCHLIISLVAFALGCILIQSAPSSAPSNSTRVRGFLRQRLLQGNSMALDENAYLARSEEYVTIVRTDAVLPPLASDIGPMKTLVAQYQILMLGKEFVEARLLIASFGFGPTIILSFLIYAQIYQSSDATSCGNRIIDYAVIMGSSLAGACIAGSLSLACNAVYSNHNVSLLLLALKVANGVGLIAIGVLMFVAQQSLYALGFAWSMYSLIAVFYIENLLECTYPISEDISLGCLFTFAYSVVGIPASLIIGKLVFEDHEDSSQCRHFGTIKSNLFVIVSMSSGFILLLFCNNVPQKRTQQERVVNRRWNEEQPLLALNNLAEV